MICLPGLTDKHYELLKELYGISKEDFLESVERNDDEFDKLFIELVVREIDDKLIEQIVTAVCDYCNS